MIAYADKNQNVKNSSSVNNAPKDTRQFFITEDNRSTMSQQRHLKTFVNDSPMMVAQQKVIQKILGAEANGVSQLEEKEEEKIQMKSAIHQLVEEEEKIQLKQQDNTFSNEGPVQKKENNTGLPDALKSGVENLSGMSLDHVKVHYASDKPAQLNALAYAQGSDIHVSPGQEKHLPHEAWHVVQQMQGRVQPTVQMEDVSINDDQALETEADVMGAKAMSAI